MQINKRSDTLQATFKQTFGRTPAVIFRAPGRVNIIGEHVDYSANFSEPYAHNYSLPFALPFNVCVAARKTQAGKPVKVYSTNFDQMTEFTSLPSGRRIRSWENHVFGVFAAAAEAGLPIDKGVEMAIAGDVPVGSGISSSAALGVSLVMALDELFGWKQGKLEIAKLAQLSEHSPFVGTKCGLLDQTASLFSKRGQAIRIDYGEMARHEETGRPKDPDTVDLSKILGQGYKFLLIDSGVSRELGGTFYNDRRSELETAGKLMLQLWEKMSGRKESEMADQRGKYVSCFDIDEFRRMEKRMGTEISGMETKDKACLDRARYVLEEKNRVLQFILFCQTGNVNKACELLNLTGKGLSMKGDFKVSATVLRDANGEVTEERQYMDILSNNVKNALIKQADREKPVKSIGLRLMGGGGGGCLIGLMPKEYDTPAFREKVGEDYLAVQAGNGYGTAYEPKFYEAVPSEGAGELRAG